MTWNDVASPLTAPRPEDIALRYMREAPPTDLVGLTAELGLIIKYEVMDEISGKIEKKAGRPPLYVITLNSKHGPNRQRFTLAHEIAHFIKHKRHLDASGIVDSAFYRSILPERMEWEANKYAAQLLMPLSSMQRLWRQGYRTASEFAQRLAVSTAAAQIRLNGLVRLQAVNNLSDFQL